MSILNTKYEIRNRRYEKGAILLITLVIMMTLTSVVGAYLGFVGSSTRSVGAQIQDSQVIYLADAGLQNVYWKLNNDADFRTSPSTVTGTLGEGSFSVDVTRDGSIYSLTSTGTVDNLSRTVTQSVITTSAVFNYAVYADTNDLTLLNNVAISGDLYCNNGDVVVTASASVTNVVYAPLGTVSGAGTYTEASGPPDEVPTYPTFNTATYDANIATADSQASSDLTLSGSSPHYLNGATEYYYTVTVQNDAILYGPGTIVCTANVELKDSGLITDDVSIITKTIVTMSGSGEIESGDFVFARGGIILQDDTIMGAGNILVPTSGNQIEMKGNTTMTGAIYAYNMKLQDYASITGSVIAHQFEANAIPGDVTITYSEDVLGSIPVGMEAGNVTLRVQTDWNET